uniref:Uncharacterized protein n=1 Tax=Spongospora subterranea TaxID=70186 RepID=A0A0H5QME8_9EUKA|eukprot:CRZ02752.1 hypothetical protein [Spongospora subterranea]
MISARECVCLPYPSLVLSYTAPAPLLICPTPVPVPLSFALLLSLLPLLNLSCLLLLSSFVLLLSLSHLFYSCPSPALLPTHHHHFRNLVRQDVSVASICHDCCSAYRSS